MNLLQKDEPWFAVIRTSFDQAVSTWFIATPMFTRSARIKTSLKFTAFSKRAKWVIYPIATLAMNNFFAFVAGSAYLGGDALNGYARSGHYFVCAHGRCVEVSSAIWHYSYWHACASFGRILLVFAVTALFLNTDDIEWKQSINPGTEILKADINQGQFRGRWRSTRLSKEPIMGVTEEQSRWIGG